MNGNLLLLSLTASFLVAPKQDARKIAFRSFLRDTCTDRFTVRATLGPHPLTASKGEARLGFHWQSDGSGFCLTIRKEGIRLLKVTKGASRPISPWARWDPQKANEAHICIQRHRPAIRVIADDRVILSASDGDFADGKVGGWVSAADVKWKSVRFQRVGPVHFTDDFMRQEGTEDPWESAAGAWALKGTRGEPKVPDPKITANPFAYRGRTDSSPRAVCTTGHWFWDGYSLRASVRPEAKGTVGLIAYYQDPDNYLIFRCATGLIAGRKQLVVVRDGKERILAEATGGCEIGQWYWLELRALPGRLAAFVDTKLACQTKCDFFGQGKAGLCASAPGMMALFDDVQVQSMAGGAQPAPFPSSDAIRAHFLSDRFLRIWAEQGPCWARQPGDTFWHEARFFSPPSVQFAPASGPPSEAKFWATICAAESKSEAGYRLRMGLNSEAPIMRWTLDRLGKTVAEADRAIGSTFQFRVEQTDATVAAYWGGKKVLEYTDPQPLRGHRVGYGTSGWLVPPEKATATCANMDDFTFSSAPVHWRVGSGTWETEPHWACTGRGAHYLGMNVGPAVLWTKQRYRGDLVVEAYLTNAEIPAHVLETPRNLNITICGDGANLGSGYTFMLGGRDGKEVRALKGAKELSRSAFTTHRVSKHNQDIWFQIRIEKTGKSLKFFVDDRVVADCIDSNPIDEGHLAVWTYAAGVVLGRLRIWYEQQGAWQPVPGPILALAKRVEAAPNNVAAKLKPPKGAIVNSFEDGFGTFTTRDWPDAAILLLDTSTAAAGKRSLAVVNRTCGSHFSAWMLSERVSLASRPLLSFDYQVPPDVKVNLYAKIDGGWYEVGFAAQMRSSPRLGIIEDVLGDGKWRHAKFDLLKAVTSTLGSPKPIDGLAFASPNDFLLRCGITGNPYGATFHLDNVRLGPQEAASDK